MRGNNSQNYQLFFFYFHFRDDLIDIDEDLDYELDVEMDEENLLKSEDDKNGGFC